MPGFDLKQINRNDQLIIGGGIVAFIASFLPYVGVSYSGFGVHYDAHINAWHGFALLGLLFIFAAAAITALRVFANTAMPTLPLGINVVIAGLAALGTILVILRALTYDHTSIEWGGYVLFIAAIVETVGAVMNFKASGEKLAWDQTAMPARSTTGAPAAPTYPAPGAAPTYPPATPPAAEYPPSDPGTPGV
jgi:hypothetical protein